MRAQQKHMQEIVASQYYEGTSTTFGAATNAETITVNQINAQTASTSATYWVTYGEGVTVSFTVTGPASNDVIYAIDSVSGKTLGSTTLPQYTTTTELGSIYFTVPWSLAGQIDLMLEDGTTSVYSSSYTIDLVYPTRFANISYPNSGQWWTGQSITVTGTLEYESASGTWSALSSQSVTLSYSGEASGTVGTATTNSSGNFSFTFSAPSPGSYTYKLSYGGSIPSGAEAAAFRSATAGSAEYAFNVVVLATSSTPPPPPPTTPNVDLILAGIGASLMAGGYGYSALKKS